MSDGHEDLAWNLRWVKLSRIGGGRLWTHLNDVITKDLLAGQAEYSAGLNS